MLPDQNESPNPSEQAVCVPVSSFPMSPLSMDDINNIPIKYFLCFIHEKRCVGGDNARFSTPCVPACLFARSPELVEFHEHLQSCKNSEICPRPYCREAQQLWLHWRVCEVNDCHLCMPIVSLVIESFVSYLTSKGPEWNAATKKLMECSNIQRKNFLKNCI